MFKQNWERSQKYIDLDINDVRSIFSIHFPQVIINDIHIQGNGCVNNNYRVNTNNGSFLLRFNTRDKALSKKEYLISKQLSAQLPIPKVYAVATYAEYDYSIQEFIEGKLLRDVILSEAESTWLNAVRQAGQAISKLTKVNFEHADFFDGALKPIKSNDPKALYSFAEKMLTNKNVQLGLGNLLEPLKVTFANNKNYMTQVTSATFVHGDFDPSNIIVQKNNGIWSLAAIIDWEFASADHWLWDVSNMLREAHNLPRNYEIAFLEGLADSGVTLPEDWRNYCAIYNIISLLDILSRSNPSHRPTVTKDICELIQHFIEITIELPDSSNF